ncbi:MAG: precorrin-6A reductase [Leptospirales bacterium]
MILLLGGTSDARELAQLLHEAKLPVLTNIVHENGAAEYRSLDLNVRCGRLDETSMSALIQQENISIVVDATHPFAELASHCAMKASKQNSVLYMRFERPPLQELEKFRTHEKLHFVQTYEEAAEKVLILQKKSQHSTSTKQIVMLTTGAKNLDLFVNRFKSEKTMETIARVLPRSESINECERLGLAQKNIVALQGPFSEELNRALFEKYKVTIMVTKESGKQGSTAEKINTALQMNIETILIERPQILYENSFNEKTKIVSAIQKIFPEN